MVSYKRRHQLYCAFSCVCWTDRRLCCSCSSHSQILQGVDGPWNDKTNNTVCRVLRLLWLEDNLPVLSWELEECCRIAVDKMASCQHSTASMGHPIDRIDIDHASFNFQCWQESVSGRRSSRPRITTGSHSKQTRECSYFWWNLQWWRDDSSEDSHDVRQLPFNHHLWKQHSARTLQPYKVGLESEWGRLSIQKS